MNGRWLLLGGVLVAGVVVFVASQLVFDSNVEPIPIDDPSDVADQRHEEPPTPDPLNVQRDDASPNPAPPEPARAVQHDPAPPQTEWKVAGQIIGLHPDVPWESDLEVHALPRPPAVEHLRAGHLKPYFSRLTLEVPVNNQGRFQFNLTAVPTIPGMNGLEILADDPGYMPVRLVLDLPLERGRLPDTPQTLTAELETTPCGVITGVVAGGRGTKVAVFPPPTQERVPLPEQIPDETREVIERLGSTDDRYPVVLPIDQTMTDRDGKYTLRINESGNYVVVALGANRPCLKHVPGTVFGTSTAPDITRADLREGGPAIAGQVIASFGPLEGARVHAMRTRLTGPMLAIDETVFLYTQGRLEYKSLFTATDELGRFRLLGLGRAEYLLEVTEVPIAGAHPDLGDRLKKRVEAPADKVMFDLTGTFVVFRVRSDPWMEGPFEVEARRNVEQCKATTDQYNEAAMFLAPGEVYEVNVNRPPFRPLRTSFRFPEDEKPKVQELSLRLPELGKTRLVLRGAEPWPKRAHLILQSEWGAPFDLVGEIPIHDGETIVNQLTPGAFQVMFTGITGDEVGPWVPVSTEVMIREADTTTCEIDIQPAGFLEVVIRGSAELAPKGVSLGVNRDRMALPLIRRPEEPDRRSSTILLKDGKHRLACPLPVGRVQVYVKHRKIKAASQTVEITAGEFTPVEFEVEPWDGFEWPSTPTTSPPHDHDH